MNCCRENYSKEEILLFKKFLLKVLVSYIIAVSYLFVVYFSVVSGSRDATLRMWDINTGECLHVLMGHVAAVRCVQYDGRLVVSGAYDYMVIYLILFWFGKTQPDPN